MTPVLIHASASLGGGRYGLSLLDRNRWDPVPYEGTLAEMVEVMNNDPLIAHETQPTQTMAAMVRADERLKKEFPQITLPVLILHGTADKNTRPSGSQHFYDMAGSTDKTLKLYEGGFHDLLNDIDKESVIVDIKSWIDGHLPAVAGDQD